jgi:hypothetical protein
MKDFLTTKLTKDTKGSDIYDHKLRDLRVLRGEICFFLLVAALPTGRPMPGLLNFRLC